MNKLYKKGIYFTILFKLLSVNFKTTTPYPYPYHNQPYHLNF